MSAILVTTPVDVINAKTAPEMTAPPPKAISAKIIYFNIIKIILYVVGGRLQWKIKQKTQM